VKDFSRFPGMGGEPVNVSNEHQSLEETLSQSGVRSGARLDDGTQLIGVARQDNIRIFVREK